MLFGMGSLSLGELAGERMKVSLEANSPEDEHDCFSDNTHNSHFYDAKGIRNVYLGEYTAPTAAKMTGAEPVVPGGQGRSGRRHRAEGRPGRDRSQDPGHGRSRQQG